MPSSSTAMHAVEDISLPEVPQKVLQLETVKANGSGKR